MSNELDIFIKKFLDESLNYLELLPSERQIYFDTFLSDNFDSLHIERLSYGFFTIKSLV